MSIAFNFGDGSVAPNDKSVQLMVRPWQYKAAFRTISDNGSIAKMADILAPVSKRTTIKISLDRIANVYNTLADVAVPVAEQSANTTGQTVFVELKTVATRERVDGSTVQLPMVGRIELRLPNDDEITDEDVKFLVAQTYASICDENGNPAVITEKMRGALTPAGI